MDRFEAMRAFACVVEVGSFTKAAEHLHLSKSSVTQLVQQLETRLRVKLLNRTTRRVGLTPDGAVYYERVVRLLADLEEVEASLAGAAAQPRGRLRVDVPSPLARLVLIPALADFHARYPDIQLDMGVSDRVVDLIGEHVDCVIRGGELADQSLVARHIGSLRLRAYAAPSYVQRAGVPRHPQELEDSHHRIVGFLWARTGKVQPTPCNVATSAYMCAAVICWPSTTAMRTWPPASPGWACSGCPTTWARRTSNGANWCRCSRSGTSSPCRCMWLSRRTGM